MKKVREELIKRMHIPVPEQGKWLCSVLNGYFNYYAVPGNKKSIDAFRTEGHAELVFGRSGVGARRLGV